MNAQEKPKSRKLQELSAINVLVHPFFAFSERVAGSDSALRQGLLWKRKISEIARQKNQCLLVFSPVLFGFMTGKQVLASNRKHLLESNPELVEFGKLLVHARRVLGEKLLVFDRDIYERLLAFDGSSTTLEKMLNARGYSINHSSTKIRAFGEFQDACVKHYSNGLREHLKLCAGLEILPKLSYPLMAKIKVPKKTSFKKWARLSQKEEPFGIALKKAKTPHHKVRV